MSAARCDVNVVRTKVARCGAIIVTRSDSKYDVLKFEGDRALVDCTAFLGGTIDRKHARDLANALLAYLDAPEPEAQS